MSARPFAEVIGDPIGHSKSPLIHGFWLEKLGIAADYRATRVGIGELAQFLAERREQPGWRGCNVTAPLKQAAAALVGDPAGVCRFVGAVNCIARTPLSCLVGTNSDIAGIAEAIDRIPLEGRSAIVIGAGGAARAALCSLSSRGLSRIILAARDPARAKGLADTFGSSNSTDAAWIEAIALESAGAAVAGAALVVNATPMGLSGGPSMHSAVLANLSAGQAVFDMVYAPLETQLLAQARRCGAVAIDGLTMLIGQAAPAFTLFFGEPPPRRFDGALRELLVR